MSDQNDAMMLRHASGLVTGIDRPGLRLRVESGFGMAKLQLLGPDPDARFLGVMGFAPPAMRRQIDGEGVTAAWLAPGEWLLAGDVATWTARIAGIGERGGSEALVVDLTDARTALLIDGNDARTAIASHCSLDLEPESFPEDMVARSPLADAGMFIARLKDTSGAPCFRLVVDQTMATYAVRMLGGPPSSSGVPR